MKIFMFFNNCSCKYHTALLAWILPANLEWPNAHTQKDGGCLQSMENPMQYIAYISKPFFTQLQQKPVIYRNFECCYVLGRKLRAIKTRYD